MVKKSKHEIKILRDYALGGLAIITAIFLATWQEIMKILKPNLISLLITLAGTTFVFFFLLYVYFNPERFLRGKKPKK